MRKSPARMGRGPGRRLRLGLLALMVLAGCGAQELYKPPTAPYEIVGRLALPGGVKGVSVLGDYAYLAGGQSGLLVVDISNPAAPALIKMLDTDKSADAVQAVTVPTIEGIRDMALVVEGTEGLTTYNVTDPENAYDYGFGATAIDANGLFVDEPENPGDRHYVYVAESWKGIRILYLDPNGTTGALGYDGAFTSTRGYAMSVTVKDGFAYVADDELGLAVVDVRVPVLGQVVVVSSCDTRGNARGVDIDGKHVYIADYEYGLVVMEIHEEGTPSVPVPYLIAELALPGRCEAVVVRDGVAFVAAQDGGLHIVDVNVPAAPELLGTVITSYATGVALAKSGYVAVSDRDEGVLVLRGPGPFSDSIPPARVTDLTAAGRDATTIRLQWTAPGDDRLTGTASQYDVRYALTSIDSFEDWQAATQCENEPAPLPRERAETFDVSGLSPSTQYFFALRTADSTPNWSDMSNVASAITPEGNVPPTLRNGSVSPGAGTPDTTFVYRVTYEDADGDPPVEARVLISGTPHDMTEVSGTYEEGALFEYQTTLDRGAYEYIFSFNDGLGGHTSVVTPVASGPSVGIPYTIGSPESEPGRDTDETMHTVVLTRDFEISDHEVTQADYESLMGANPSRFVGANLPVDNVTWLDAINYCNARSRDEGLTEVYTVIGSAVTWNKEADGYRLPTEAEWEVACRAGTNTAFALGDLTDEACGPDPILESAGWYCGNAGATTHEVKTKQPNTDGLYDMHGNVWEWCWDYYEADLGSGVAFDPEGPPAGSQRAIRGGSWWHFARECRSASRAPYWPNSRDDILGFRVARTIF